jgi:uncharacterized membrane protein YhaH (DUF805 family)
LQQSRAGDRPGVGDSYAQFKLAQKVGCSNNAWWSFIPILNSLLLLQMARKPMWWFLLMLVPLVNIVIFAILWIDVAKAVGKSGFLGFCTLVPVVNLVTVGILAFTGSDNREGPFPPKSPSQPRQPQSVA